MGGGCVRCAPPTFSGVSLMGGNGMKNHPARSSWLLGFLILIVWGLVSCSSQEPSEREKGGSKSGIPASGPVGKVEGAGEGSVTSAPRTTSGAEPLGGSGLADSLKIEEVSLEPAAPVTGESLRAVVRAKGAQARDTDFSYSWKINGQPVLQPNSNVLDRPVFRGDYVEVTVTPIEGGASAKSATSFVVIANAAPALRVQSQSLGADGKYEAHILALDPENDSITFSLRKGPPGMSIDPSTGILRWSPGPDVHGTHEVEVSAVDIQGAEAILSYQIQIRRETMGGTETK